MDAWDRVQWFLPAPDTLGYNDGFFLYGMLHAVFRAAGADIFVAATLVDVAVKAIGFVGLHLLLRQAFGCRFGYALWAAAVFTLSHGSFRHALHQQLLAVSFLPVLALLAWRAARALGAGRPGAFVAWGAGAAALWGAWLLTAYYAAWFTTFFALVLALVAWPVLGRARMQAALALCRHHWRACAAVAACVAVSAVPFLRVYLPKLAETGGQSWRESLFYSPRLNDILNLGSDATMWGGFRAVLCPYCTRDNFELTVGITPILLWLFVAGTILLLWRRPAAPLPRAVALATVAVTLLTIRWGNVSAWWLVWRLVPGAGGLRVVSRILLFLAAPVVVVAATYLQALASRVPAHLVVLLGALVLAEQIQPAYPMYTRSAELARLDVPAAPAACRAFYVGPTEGSDQPNETARLYPHNVEAMLLSEHLGMPTLNGFSTFNPPGWDFGDPLRADYNGRVRAYAARFGIVGLCRLDLMTRTWSGP